MGIIERALEKQRQEAEGARQAPRPASRPRETAEPAGGLARALRVPAESVQADLEALRAGGLLPPAAAEDRLTEQFRRIKWPLLESLADPSTTGAATPNTVLITSSTAGEGKSFVCFNLALSIARERDRDVLIVDADVAKRHLTRLLGAAERPGLTECASEASVDPEQLIVGTGIAGLSFLPSGQRTNLASELFASRRMAEVVEGLRRAASQRIVLFDSSPLLATTETQVLASLVDQIVLVVSAESTPQPVVLEASRLLDHSKQIRCLLNQTRVSQLNEYYYYGYGYAENEQPPRQP